MQPLQPLQPRTTIGIVAHVDAGKTSLTERLLYATGVTDHLGTVDTGDTQTDLGAIERRRGITITSGVVAFHLDDLRVTLVDTPGHAEFVAEVERALGVLDAAVLVVSAVEGVQSHTRLLMRTLGQLGIPAVLFLNKLDRAGARPDEIIDDLRSGIAPGVLPVNACTGAGTADAATTSRLWNAGFVEDALQLLALHDDVLLRDVVDATEPPPLKRVRRTLRSQVRRGQVHPLVLGSARTGAGVDDLLTVVHDLLPRADADDEAPLAGRVFAFDRSAGAKAPRPLLRLDRGVLSVRDRVRVARVGESAADRTLHRVTALRVVGGDEHASAVHGGDIAAVTGLGPIRVGDAVVGADTDDDRAADVAPSLPRPDLRTIVTAKDPEQTTELFQALAELSARDPLIKAEFVGDGRVRVLLFGEVQQQVLADTLAEEFGVLADFATAELRHTERPAGIGEAFVDGFPLGLIAQVGVRVEPAAPGAGIVYGIESEYGALLVPFHEAVEETVRSALSHGLCGWPVTDVRVTLIRSGYDSVGSTAGDFRRLTPLPLFAALRQAGTRVYEPLHAFDLEVPADTVGPVLAALTRHEADVHTSEPATGDRWSVTGEIPLREIPALRHTLPGLTRGEAAWLAVPGGDRLLTGEPPASPRTDGNPLDQVAYLRHLRGW